MTDTPAPLPAENIVEVKRELAEAASDGADLSPGDPMAWRAHDAICALQAEIAALRAKAQTFLNRVDELTPDINGIFQIAAIHGAKWPKDANWVVERAALTAALADNQGKEIAG